MHLTSLRQGSGRQACSNPWCHQPFVVTDDDRRFLERLSPVIGGRQFPIPNPTLCPSCRMQRRLSFRNERHLYRRTCDKTGQSIVSMFSPVSPRTVYSINAWWSDGWDPRSYGREIDWSRPFLEQVAELAAVVPVLARTTGPDSEEQNCFFVNFAGGNKDCYLMFDSDFNEDVEYANVMHHCRDCIDCSYLSQCERCYECRDCQDCYGLVYSAECRNCSTASFLQGCIGCRDCIGCCNMHNKQYCIWNEQKTKEEYESTLSELHDARWSTMRKFADRFTAHTLRAPHRYANLVQADACSGDYIAQAERCSNCFNVTQGQDLTYCDSLFRAKDCMDVSSFGENIELVYDGATVGHDTQRIYFCFTAAWSCSDLFYCLECRRARYCFGCASMNENQYCILNRQYTKEEYEALVPRIIAHMQSTGEWGTFFPPSMSAFGYNETVAQEYFPLTKDEALARGFCWSDYESPPPTAERVIAAAQLPDAIDSIPDDVLNWAIECEATKRPFKIIKQELDFYRQMKLPLPRLHPDERHGRRMTLRNPRKLWKRNCAKCGKKMETTYEPSRPEVVYCEECYLKEIY